ncbi:hypothetical protein GGI07_001997 [Coemansia sp. Benny D115]|nr:hypothetical protein GGI07_001997 [Coemansia sp. Benny D115]
MTFAADSSSAPPLAPSDLLRLQDLSARLKAMREPVRDLVRAATRTSDASASVSASPESERLFARAREQLDAAHTALLAYTASLVPGASRARSDTGDSSTYRMQRPTSLHAAADSAMSAPAQHASATMPALPSTRSRAPLPNMTEPGSPASAEAAIAAAWQGPAAATTARPVNEAHARLSSRHAAALEERLPFVPLRELRSAAPVAEVDLVQSLLRAGQRDAGPSVLTRSIDMLPPGIVACAIANSTAQLFRQLTPDAVAQHAASTEAHPALRALSDHANFLTRLVETSIIFPLQPAQRARRIEWWTVVVCLVRELGDYESLSSLACVFSSALIGRLRESWQLVPAPCKAAIRFLLERVLKMHPNYASYREELHARVSRMQRKRPAVVLPGALTTAGADELSLDFDAAIAINSPDLCSSNDNYVSSPVFCKEAFDLPPPRALVPIVAVLLKDAAASSHSTPAAPTTLAASVAASTQWAAVVSVCAEQELPIALDYFMLRRVFATELSALATPASSTPRAISAATNFLRRMPRRQSASEKSPKELTATNCRLLESATPPTVVDLLAHLLYLAAGSPCFNCVVGAQLNRLLVSTSAQLAVTVTASLLFAEPWMPREYLARMCDMREPRADRRPTATPSAVTSPQAPRLSTSSSGSQGSDSRAAERPWLASFRLSDSMDSTRYTKPKSSKHSSIDSARKTSTDSDSTFVYRPQSPNTTAASATRYSSSTASATIEDRMRSSVSDANSDSASARRPTSAHSVQSVASSLSAAISPRAGGIPVLPPLPSDSRSPPPLPATNMPTWLPTDGAAASKSPIISAAKSLPKDSPLSSGLPPPPLPSLPMPKFQPKKTDAKSPQPPPIRAKSPMPPAFTQIPPPLPSAEMPTTNLSTKEPTTASAKHADNISAEAQMLLNFTAPTYN